MYASLSGPNVDNSSFCNDDFVLALSSPSSERNTDSSQQSTIHTPIFVSSSLLEDITDTSVSVEGISIGCINTLSLSAITHQSQSSWVTRELHHHLQSGDLIDHCSKTLLIILANTILIK